MLNNPHTNIILSGYGTNNYNQGGEYMRGRISTYQKCPKCGAEYPSSKGGFPIICKNGCQTQPTKYYVEYFWKGQRWRATPSHAETNRPFFMLKIRGVGFLGMIKKV